jgi:phenylpropionate dioxygenase-like ring-hydroxylating dioxygenase large terminal subunit
VSTPAAVDADRRFENTEPGLANFWHPVAMSSELNDDEPLGVSLAGRRWALVRLAGQLSAFVDMCPHRLAPLSAGTIVDDTLQCPYHGFRFAADGRCVEIPSAEPRARIPEKANASKAFGVCERYGMIWLAPSEPLRDIIAIPEWDDPSFLSWHLPPVRTRVSAGMLVDNFIDASHFPYLHLATFGADDPGKPQLEFTRGDWHVQVINRGQPNTGLNYGTAQALQTYEIAAPFSLRIEVRLAGGPINTFLFFIQPESATSSRIYFAQSYNDVQPGSDLFHEVSKFNAQVLEEDLALLHRYPDPRMPLVISRELHVKADLGTVEYRRMAAAIAAL